jgi:hypothetical protein
MGAVHIDGQTGGRSLKPQGKGGQHVIVGMLDRVEVELTMRHWEE